jgi:tetratricopeptide (TPR) repeat protein
MYFQRGLYVESEELCQQALDWISTLNDHQLRASILNTLGALQSATGELKESIKTFKLCLADFRAAGNTIRQGYVLLNIGLTLTDMGEYANAAQNLKESLAIAFTEKDLHLVEICYQNIARCHLAEKETILARSVLDTARRILPGLNSRALESELDLIDAKILRAMGDLDGADARLKETHTATKDHDLAALQADVLMEQGLLAKDKGDAQMAACKLEAASNQYQQLGVEKGFREAIEALSTIKVSISA